MPESKDDDVLTEEQVDALADLIICAKRMVFAPSGSAEEREAARKAVLTVDRIRKAFGE